MPAKPMCLMLPCLEFDIQESIDSIEKYLVEKHDFKAYIADKRLRRAVEREFEII